MGYCWIDAYSRQVSSRQEEDATIWRTNLMATLEVDTAVNTRSAPRVRLTSRLVVDGQDLLGFPYTEDAEVYDISQSGISFYLSNRPWIDDSLEITIFPLDAETADYFSGQKARGKVVRTGEITEDKQFVAARFEN
jgi:hypothetical protein